MKYKVTSVEEKTTTKGTNFWMVELEDENHVRKSASAFWNKSPEVDKEYDLTFTVKGDYTYMNLVKEKSSGGFKKKSYSGRPDWSYPDKEERLETRKSIEGQAILKTIFTAIYTQNKTNGEREKDFDFWYNKLKDLFK